MKVRINGVTRDFRTLWREGKTVKMINQRKLPHSFEIHSTSNYVETAEAIKNMTLRGAGAIGVAGAYGLAQAAFEFSESSAEEFEVKISDAAELLVKTRPTAVNLSNAVSRCLSVAGKGTVAERVKRIVNEADAIAEEDLESSRRIGDYGSQLIRDGSRLLTHCNAGALAFIDYGTALSPIRLAHEQGKEIFVFVDETRPRCQGSKLTSWELKQEGIQHAVIVDNAAGYFMRKGEIDMVIVGADRIAANGDVANKIGTYEKAVLAKENGIPFYVAAPRMTFDLECNTGDEIVIEERDAEEVLSIWGEDENQAISKVYITPRDTLALNPAFDVTPAKYITGFITEVGIIKSPYRENIVKKLSRRLV